MKRKTGVIISGLISITLSFFGCSSSSLSTVEISQEKTLLETKTRLIKCEIDTSWTSRMSEYVLPPGSSFLEDIELSPNEAIMGIKYSMDNGIRNNSTINESTIQLLSLKDNKVVKQFRVPKKSYIYELNDNSFSIYQPPIYEYSYADYVRGNRGGHIETQSQLLYMNYLNDNVDRSIEGMWGTMGNRTISFAEDTAKVWNKLDGTLLLARYKEGINQKDYGSWKTDDNIFFLRDGLWSLNIKNGNIWYFEATHYYKDHLAGVGKSLLSAIGAGLTHQSSYTMYGADITYGLNSKPYCRDNVVMFVSEKYLTCLNAKDGAIIWQKDVQGRPGMAYVGALNMELGVAVEYGIDIKNRSIRETENPYLSIFDFSNGEEKFHFVPENKEVIQGIQSYNGKCYFYTDNCLYFVGADFKIYKANIANIKNIQVLNDCCFVYTGNMLYYIDAKNNVNKINSDGTNNIKTYTGLLLHPTKNNMLIVHGQLDNFLIYSIDESGMPFKYAEFSGSWQSKNDDGTIDYSSIPHFVNDKMCIFDQGIVSIADLKGNVLRKIKTDYSDAQIRHFGSKEWIVFTGDGRFALVEINSLLRGIQ